MEDSKAMRWWIVEDALRDRKGHWLEYLQTFQMGLKAEGDEVRFFASRECAPDVAALLDAECVLPPSIWARMSDGAAKWRRLLRIPAHGLATYRAVSKLLAGCSAPHALGYSPTRRSYEPEGAPPAGRALPDVIFAPTVLVHHLAGWVPLIKWKLSDFHGRILLFFPNAPVFLDEQGSTHIASDPTARLFVLFIKALFKEVSCGKVVLGAETEAMTKALTEVTGVRFTYFPHPVELSPKSSLATCDSVGRLGNPSPQTPVSADRQGDLVALGLSPLRSGSASPPVSVDRQGDLSTASPPVPATSADPIVFGCYGAARYEKGSDILQTAIRVILERDPEIPARFAFQWLGDFADARGNIVKLDPWLKDHPKVEVIERYFEEGGYADQLAATDVMVLPYRNPYRLRVSRVVIEAMILGIPAVATRDTTLWSQLSEFGVGRECDDGSIDSLATAICGVAKEFTHLAAEARGKAGQSEEHFSVKNFRKTLFSNLPKRLAD